MNLNRTMEIMEIISMLNILCTSSNKNIKNKDRKN